jgi:predicted nucleic acid-binding protein
MTYLVDANVLSEPTRPAPSSKVVAWLSVDERDLVVDSIIAST